MTGTYADRHPECEEKHAEEMKAAYEAKEDADQCRVPSCERRRFRDLATCWEHAFPGVEQPRQGDDHVEPYFPSGENEEEKRRRYRLFRRM
jgi:hypothetical protein